MIIWLSSYPRSGNTLFRIALNQLGLGPTYSVYDDPALKELELENIVGHEDLPEGGLQYLEQLEKPVFVKTHGLPGSDDYPVIYLVRDGRDATVSFAHYLKNIQNDCRHLSEILAGLVSQQDGNIALWSDHVRKWYRRHGRYVKVRFEDLQKNPISEVVNALEKLGIGNFEISGNVQIPSFEDLQKENNKFFRKGETGGWKSDMNSALERQFWRWNRWGMRVAGYEGWTERPPLALAPYPEVDCSTLGIEIDEVDPILEGICMPPYVDPKENADFDFLISFARQRGVSRIFEFGTAEGNTVANLCRNTNAHITTLNALPEETSGTYRTYDLDREKIGWVYRKYGYGERVKQIFQDSMDFIPGQFSDGHFYDLVIIDACHDYEYVLNDFLTIYPYLSSDGAILFHDSDPSMVGHLEGVWKACSYLYRAGFDIKQVQGTWWAYWSPEVQKQPIDQGLLSLFDYEIEKTREKNTLEKHYSSSLKHCSSLLKRKSLLLKQSEAKLDRVRRLPGLHFAQWLNTVFSRLRKRK